jgi:AraC family transcriptional regulator
MEPRIEVIAPKKLIGMRVQMSLANERTAQLWQGFRPRVGEIAHRANRDFISMQVYTPPQPTVMTHDSVFERWAAVEVANHAQIPPGMEPYDLPGGKYAVFVYRGPANAFAPTWRYIFTEWLPQSSHRLDMRPHFEVLGEHYRPMDPQAQEEVWIPLE